MSIKDIASGLSLRDIFACAALAGMCVYMDEISDEAQAARYCYQLADWMLEAREHQGEQNPRTTTAAALSDAAGIGIVESVIDASGFHVTTFSKEQSND